MKSLNRSAFPARIVLPALLVAPFLSLTSKVAAQSTLVRADGPTTRPLLSPALAARPWPSARTPFTAALAGPSLRPDHGTAATRALPTADLLELVQPVSAAPRVEALLRVEARRPDSAASRSATLPSDPQEASLLFSRSVIRSTGAIEADLDAFRALLGDPNNGVTIGQQPAGRREINWDAVPAAVTNVLTFPNNFFNTNSPRGLLYGRASRGLEVSDLRFTDLNPTYAAEFTPFSGQKLFSPIGNNEAEVHFRVAGSGIDATVRGFGAVFVDVDLPGVSGFELFDDNGLSLGRFTAPVRSDARGASFVGVVFRNPLIAKVRITLGDGRLAPNEIDLSQGGQHDLVVLDDFVYGEPMAPGS